MTRLYTAWVVFYSPGFPRPGFFYSGGGYSRELRKSGLAGGVALNRGVSGGIVWLHEIDPRRPDPRLYPDG